MKSRASAGFTLIELLVVIGVIGSLAGMLLPALHKARGCARNAGCICNLKQMGYALSLYVDDNDGYIPRRGQGVQRLTQISRMSDWFKPRARGRRRGTATSSCAPRPLTPGGCTSCRTG